MTEAKIGKTGLACTEIAETKSNLYINHGNNRIIMGDKKIGDKTAKDKIVVTAALPYANGEIHIGHLLEYIQTDIFVRFLKLTGHDALYICASDMHGTPIEINAAKVGEKPEKFALKFWKKHQQDFKSYLIEFDNYHKTHSKENQQLAEYFFSTLKKKGHIYQKKINTIYCNYCQRSLPDRFVKGTCPNCTTRDQYGDVCESCSSVLKGIDLINPKCVTCGRTPVQKESEHYFFKLSSFSDKLKKWMKDKKSAVQPELQNWLGDWIKKGLDDWCISRDGPYFGFEIPDSKKETGETKYFYVWLDAPIGYISSTMNYCAKDGKGKKSVTNEGKGKLKPCQWEDYWKHGQVYHFIGKDIAYFHYLFWPAMLMAVDIPVPKLTTHGFINVNDQKMSKSRGTFFTAEDFIKLYSAESLRFFYASHLDRKVVDISLNFDNFKDLNNGVLVGNLGNFCYRVLTFAEKNYGEVKEVAKEPIMTKKVESLMKKVEENYQNQNFKEAVKNILQIADLGNAYFQKSEPWKDKNNKETKAAVGWCVNLARNLSVLVSPVLPDFSLKIQEALGEDNAKKPTAKKTPDHPPLAWDNISFSWKGKLKKVEKLVEKIEKVPQSQQFPLNMKVGQIIDVKNHPNADSLYVMKVDFGKKLEKKQVVAGLKKYRDKKELLKVKATFVVNLKPAKLRGEVSEAMILVADDKENISFLEAPNTPLGEEVTVEGMENSTSEVTFEEFQKIIFSCKQGNVLVEGKKLITPVEDVVVHGVKEGSRVF